MSITVLYPYDKSGTNEKNIILNESHSLITMDNSFRIIVPISAPFFEHDLNLIHGPTGKVLERGVDFELSGELIDADVLASSPLYSFIQVLDKSLLNGFLLDYRTLGGALVAPRPSIINYITDKVCNPRELLWENVHEVPADFVPIEHGIHWMDYVNKSLLAESLDNLNNAISDNGDYVINNGYAQLETIVTTLESIVSDGLMVSHAADTGAHDTAASDIGALALGEAAKDTKQAYGMSLQQLINNIISEGVQKTELDAFIKRIDDNLADGDITFSNNGPVIKSDDNSSIIDFAAETLGLITKGSNSLTSGSGFTIETPANTLTFNNQSRSEAELLINGKRIVTDKNILSFIEANPPEHPGISTRDNLEVSWTGSGTPDSGLHGLFDSRMATHSEPGAVKVSNTTSSSNNTDVISYTAFKDIVNGFNNLVENTTKVNGKALTGNITLTKSNVGLGSVNNISDADKPISTDQSNLLDNYSDNDHYHTHEEANPPLATDSVSGIVVRTSVDPINAVTFQSHSVPVMSDYQLMDDIILDYDFILNTKLPNTALAIRSWITTPGVTPYTVGSSLNIAGGHKSYYYGLEYSLPSASISLLGLSNGYHYVHLEFNGTAANYVILDSIEDTDDKYLYIIGIEKADGSYKAWPSIKKQSWTYAVDGDLGSITSVGPFKEILGHTGLTSTAHPNRDPLSVVDPISNLGLVYNIPIVNGPSPMHELNHANWKLYGSPAISQLQNLAPYELNACIAQPRYENYYEYRRMVRNPSSLYFPSELMSTGGVALNVLFNHPRNANYIDNANTSKYATKDAYDLEFKRYNSTESLGIDRLRLILGNTKDTEGNIKSLVFLDVDQYFGVHNFVIERYDVSGNLLDSVTTEFSSNTLSEISSTATSHLLDTSSDNTMEFHVKIGYDDERDGVEDPNVDFEIDVRQLDTGGISKTLKLVGSVYCDINKSNVTDKQIVFTLRTETLDTLAVWQKHFDGSFSIPLSTLPEIPEAIGLADGGFGFVRDININANGFHIDYKYRYGEAENDYTLLPRDGLLNQDLPDYNSDEVKYVSYIGGSYIENLFRGYDRPVIDHGSISAKDEGTISIDSKYTRTTLLYAISNIGHSASDHRWQSIRSHLEVSQDGEQSSGSNTQVLDYDGGIWYDLVTESVTDLLSNVEVNYITISRS